MEDLTKHQLILLALLVSFVTSIAASIATASLLDQAPPRVTETIHRVVERTVETVVPSESPNKPATVTQEKTVIVREEDAITEAIATVSSSVVRLYLTADDAQHDDDDATGPDQISRFRGIAIVIGTSGRLVTSSRVVVSGTQNTYEAKLSDGTLATAAIDERSAENGLATLVLTVPAGGTIPEPVTFGDITNLRLGQTMLGLGGNNTANVSVGIIASITPGSESAVRELTVSFTSNTHGMPLVNLFGEVIGFSAGLNTSVFIPASRVIGGAPTQSS